MSSLQHTDLQPTGTLQLFNRRFLLMFFKSLFRYLSDQFFDRNSFHIYLAMLSTFYVTSVPHSLQCVLTTGAAEPFSRLPRKCGIDVMYYMALVLHIHRTLYHSIKHLRLSVVINSTSSCRHQLLELLFLSLDTHMGQMVKTTDGHNNLMPY